MADETAEILAELRRQVCDIHRQVSAMTATLEQYRPLLELIRQHSRPDGTIGLAGAWRAGRAARNGR